METKSYIELTKDEMFDLEQLTGKHYRLSVFNHYDGCRTDELRGEVYRFNFPFTEEEYLEVFEDSPLPFVKENMRVIYAILVMMRACMVTTYGKPFPDKLEDMFPKVSEVEEQEDWYQDYMQANYLDKVNEFYYHHSKEDLLKLYIAMHDMKLLEEDSTEVAIKIGKNKAIKLKNKDNWFVKVLLSNHLEKYIKSVKSKEQAEAELRQLKHKGKENIRPLVNNFLYGTCKMYIDHTNNTTISKGLCGLIVELCKLMGFPKDYTMKMEGDPDYSYLRSRISTLLAHPEKSLTNMEVSSISEGDEWDYLGSQLYVKMS